MNRNHPTTVRLEIPSDAPAIQIVTQAAFAEAEHRSGTEGAIVDALRRAGALTVSLVAEENGEIVGHIAFSPVTVGGVNHGWFGLGPVSVRPDRQGLGIGARLVENGLSAIRAAGARGCVVLGDPGYYGRFAFRQDERIRYPGVPSEYFMALAFCDDVPDGDVAYNSAFEAG